MKKLLLTLALLLTAVSGWAGLSVYIPQEWKNFNSSDTLLYKETDTTNKYTWSKSRSKESDHWIVYWDKYYKDTIPTNAGDIYKVDIDDLLEKAEEFYALNVGSLKFVDLTSDTYLNTYKGIIILNHNKDWICNGGGYDYTVPALWLSPSTCKPVGHSVAHEVGHSFQYMAYSDASKGGTVSTETGFHSAIGNGSTTWEATAQWQAAQAYPQYMYEQSIDLYRVSHNYAMTHEWMRYQSYWMMYYWQQKHGKGYIGQLWNYNTSTVLDINQIHMAKQGWTSSPSYLYREYFDAAMHLATWDLDICRTMGEQYIGDFNYDYVALGNGTFQVAYSSCPQSTGYNVIPLQVPAAGTTVTTSFTALPVGSALASGDPKQYYGGLTTTSTVSQTTYNSGFTGSTYNRGFRLGYVALLNDGTRKYFYEDKVYCSGSSSSTLTEDVSFEVPENTKQMWLIVVPCPASYIQHKWQEDIKKDDQWPYKFTLTNTTIDGYYSDSDPISDVTFDIDMYQKPMTDYTAVYYSLTTTQKNKLCSAFHLSDFSSLNDLMTTYVAPSSLANGKAFLYECTKDGTIQETITTANGAYGYWLTKDGTITSWNNSSTHFCEPGVDAYNLWFNVGQFPSANSAGTDLPVYRALVYKDSNGNTATAYFNVTLHVNTTGTNTTGFTTQRSLQLEATVGATATSQLTDGDDASLMTAFGYSNLTDVNSDNITVECSTSSCVSLAFDWTSKTFTTTCLQAMAGTYPVSATFTDNTSGMQAIYNFSVELTSDVEVDYPINMTDSVKNSACTGTDFVAPDNWHITTFTEGNFQANSHSVAEVGGLTMETPYIEYWRGSWLGYLQDATITHDTLTNMAPGYYSITITARMYSEAGTQNPTGISFFANDATYGLSQGTAATTNQGYQDTLTLYCNVEADGQLRFGFNVKDATCNWLAFKDVTLQYWGQRVSEEMSTELLATIPTGKMNATVESNMTAAATALSNDKTSQTKYNALSTCIDAAKSSIEKYAKLNAALQKATAIYDNCPTDAQTAYTEAVSSSTSGYNEGTITDGEMDNYIGTVNIAYKTLVKSQNVKGCNITEAIDAADCSEMSNWTTTGSYTLHVDTWANVDSYLSTPFIEYWRGSGDGTLDDCTVNDSITGLYPNTRYTVKMLARLYDEAGTKADATTGPAGVSMYVGTNTVDLSTLNNTFTQGSMIGKYGTYTLTGKTNANGVLNFGFKLQSATCNWISVKSIDVTYMGAASVSEVTDGVKTAISGMTTVDAIQQVVDEILEK